MIKQAQEQSEIMSLSTNNVIVLPACPNVCCEGDSSAALQLLVQLLGDRSLDIAVQEWQFCPAECRLVLDMQLGVQFPDKVDEAWYHSIIKLINTYFYL